MNKQVDKKPPTCQKCQMKFARKDNLTRHLRTQHSINKVVSCKICCKMFETNSMHSDHMKLEHSRTIEFNCEKCGKYFDSRKNQQQHHKRCRVQCINSNAESQILNHNDLTIKYAKVEYLEPVVKNESVQSNFMDIQVPNANCCKIEFESDKIKREINEREVKIVTKIQPLNSDSQCDRKKSLKSTNSDFIAKSVIKSESNAFSNVIYISKSEIKSNTESNCAMPKIKSKTNTSAALQPTAISNVVYVSKSENNVRPNAKAVVPKKPSLKRSWPKIYDFAGYSKKIKLDPNSSLEKVETKQNEQKSNPTNCESLFAQLMALEAKLDEMNKDFEIQTKQSKENLKELKTKVQEESMQFETMTIEIKNKRLLKEVLDMNNVFYM